jgi:pyrimidine-specific ribonucleoside hydrolase
MLRRFFFLALLCCSVTILVIAAPASAKAPTPVIIDTDMTTDDWMAILYILNNPDIDVEAITVTGTGFGTCESGTYIALGLLAMTEYGNVPVSCWTDTPLMGENPVPPEWRVTMEAAEALELPEGGVQAADDSVELFTSTIQNASQNITVLALGPLTNVGAALEAEPTLTDKIDMIYIMGGAVDVPGSGVSDENTTAEWNIYADPHAARLVFDSGAPITLVPLDATNEAPVTPDFVEQLATGSTPETAFIENALAGSAESIESGSYYFWDPLAAAVLTHPELVTLETRNVTVIDEPGADYGRTQLDDSGAEIQVATQPDVEAFKELFFNTLNGEDSAG